MPDDKLREAVWLGVAEQRCCRKPTDPVKWDCPFPGEPTDNCLCRSMTNSVLSAAEKTHVLISREPTEADIDRMAKAIHWSFNFSAGEVPLPKGESSKAWRQQGRAAHSALVRGDDS